MHLVFLVGIWGPAKFPLPVLFLVLFRFLVALIKMIIFSSFSCFHIECEDDLLLGPFSASSLDYWFSQCTKLWQLHLCFYYHSCSFRTFVCFLLSLLSLSFDKLSSWKVWWQKVYCCGQNDNWNVLLLRIWNSLTVTGDMGHTFVFGFVFDFLYL